MKNRILGFLAASTLAIAISFTTPQTGFSQGDTIVEHWCTEDFGSLHFFDPDNHRYSVQFTMFDPSGQVPFEQKLQGSRIYTNDFRTPFPGTWTITVAYTCLDSGFADSGVEYIAIRAAMCEELNPIPLPGVPQINHVLDGTVYSPLGKAIPVRLAATYYSLYQRQSNSYALLWRTPAGTTIVDMSPSRGQRAVDTINILLNDGSVYRTIWKTFFGWTEPQFVGKCVTTNSYYDFNNIVGDARYIFANGFVYGSQDLGATWKLDTAGLKSYCKSLAMDSSGTAYAVTDSGLYNKKHSSSEWIRDTSYRATVPYLVYVDRRQRIFVVSGYAPNRKDSVACSTDGGATWRDVTAGVGNLSFRKLADDSSGTMYAISYDENYLLRSIGGTAAWEQIQQPILTAMGCTDGGYFFNDLQATDTMCLATQSGIYISADHGVSWQNDTVGLRAYSLGALVKEPAGNLVISAPYGIYSTSSAGAQWTNLFFRSCDYYASYPLFRDDGEISQRPARRFLMVWIRRIAAPTTDPHGSPMTAV